jgi:hypothetical protein
VPRRKLDLTGRPLLVRAFFAVNSRLPAYDRALFGRGAIALSAEGRARFDTFPSVIADDLYLDSLFSYDEKREVGAVVSTVATPRRTRDLVRRLVRVRAGNAAMRAASAAGSVPGLAGSGPDRAGHPGRPASAASPAPPGVRSSARSSWLRDVVLPRPWLWPAGACYAAITVTAALTAKRRGSAVDWGRDESSRQPAAR